MKNTLNCVIVDDDKSAIRILTDHIQEFPNLKIVKTYTRPVQALSELSRDQNVDLIFLDIDMPGMSGIQLAENLQSMTPNIIFTTAHDKFAVKAFDVRAKDFLLKPIALETFATKVNKVINECFSNDENYIDTAFFRPGDRGTISRINKTEISYIQAAGNYVDIYSGEDRHTIYMTIKEMTEILSKGNQFFRVHKSFLINGSYVTRIVGNIVYLGKHPIPMSDPYKGKFTDFIVKNTWISKRI